MFMIPLNNIEGVELIIEALKDRAKARNCPVSEAIAKAIPECLYHVGADGKVMHVDPGGIAGYVPEPPKLRKPGLHVVK